MFFKFLLRIFFLLIILQCTLFSHLYIESALGRSFMRLHIFVSYILLANKTELGLV